MTTMVFEGESDCMEYDFKYAAAISVSSKVTLGNPCDNRTGFPTDIRTFPTVVNNVTVTGSITGTFVGAGYGPYHYAPPSRFARQAAYLEPLEGPGLNNS